MPISRAKRVVADLKAKRDAFGGGTRILIQSAIDELEYLDRILRETRAELRKEKKE